MALFECCWREKIMEAKRLIEAEADVNERNREGETPLHVACEFGCFEIAEALIEAGADVNARDNHGVTPLIKACSNIYTLLAKLLLDSGAEVNAVNGRDNESYTALHAACANDDDILDDELVKLLLRRGADPTIENQQQRTAFRYLCDDSDYELFENYLDELTRL